MPFDRAGHRIRVSIRPASEVACPAPWARSCGCIRCPFGRPAIAEQGGGAMYVRLAGALTLAGGGATNCGGIEWVMLIALKVGPALMVQRPRSAIEFDTTPHHTLGAIVEETAVAMH